MDQAKIGRFIADRRKEANLTQMQLAEKMNITNRAVSKWETGKAMPDTSLMLDLCNVLKINVNDLLSGEIVTMENYNKKLEPNLLEMVKQKEYADKKLLSLEVFIGVLVTVILAGYYECAKCGHRYVPTYSSVLWAAHINRTRHMRCPKCNEKSWQKKVLCKE